jgi:hypothetical protein
MMACCRQHQALETASETKEVVVAAVAMMVVVAVAGGMVVYCRQHHTLLTRQSHRVLRRFVNSTRFRSKRLVVSMSTVGWTSGSNVQVYCTTGWRKQVRACQW